MVREPNINRTGHQTLYCPHYTHDWRPYLKDHNEWQQKATHPPGIGNCPNPFLRPAIPDENSAAKELLILCATLRSWSVKSENLTASAELVRNGFIDAVDGDGDDGILVFITEKGTRYALKQGWIEPDESGLYRPYREVQAEAA